MVESMVERVARVLQERKYGKGCPVWEEDLAEARAAVAAMRELTDAMVDAASGAGLCPSDVSDIYIDMIDAALNEQVAG